MPQPKRFRRSRTKYPTRIPLDPYRRTLGKVPNSQYKAYLQALERRALANKGKILAEFNHMQNVAVMVSAQEIVNQLLSRATVQMSKNLLAAVEAFAESLQTAQSGGAGQSRLLQIYEHVGRRAQQATIRAYKRSPYIKLGHHYRFGDPGRYKRFSKNAMLNALSGPALYRVGPDGLTFINAPMMDRTARQWYRLNFGARPGHSRGASPQQTYFKLFGERIGKGPNLNSFRPSREFQMPAGIWSEELRASTSRSIRPSESGKAFYPQFLRKEKGRLVRGPDNKPVNQTGKGADPNAALKRSRVTKGIAAARFLDAGVAAIVHDLPAAMEVLMLEWLEEAGGRARMEVNGKRGERLPAGGPMHSALRQRGVKLQAAERQLRDRMQMENSRLKKYQEMFGRAAKGSPRTRYARGRPF